MVFVVVDEKGDLEQHEYCPSGHEKATNNQMELQACVEALEYLESRYCSLNVSDYSKIVITKGYESTSNGLRPQEQRWEQVGRQTCSAVSPGLLESAVKPGECSAEEDDRIRSGWKRLAIESETYDSSCHLRILASSTGLEIQV